MANPARFEGLVFSTKRSGIQAHVFFPNGYGASVVRGSYTYGGDEGLYELAVLKGDERWHELTYETPATSDVMGHLSEQEVSDALAQIAALPARATAEQSA